MPWVYLWTVKTDEKDTEVRLDLGVLGREVVRVNGVAVSDAYSWRMRRRVGVPLGAGHSAGLEISMAQLWPQAALSVDGKTVAPTQKPRVPLWGWAFALVSAGIFVAPMMRPDIAKGAARGAVAGLAIGSCIYASAGLNAAMGMLVCTVFTVGAWAITLALK